MQLHLETERYTQSEWHQIVSQFDDLNLIQTWEYGEAKSRIGGWEVVRHVFYDDKKVVGVAQAVIKKVPLLNRGLVWINRGPLWQKKDAINDPLILRDILRILVEYWAQKRGMYVRIAPTLQQCETEKDLIHIAGLHERKDSQWISVTLDLTKSANVLRAGLDKKWRNCLAKAEKSGLTYTAGTSAEFMDELVEDYRALLTRKQFSSVAPEFILNFQQILPHECKMIVLCARKGTKKLGSILIARYGNTAEYLIGAVGPEGRVENAGQLLLWNAILMMQSVGIKKFDLGGVHPEKTPKGILHFKLGIGGTTYRLIGEFDVANSLIAQGIKRLVQYRS